MSRRGYKQGKRGAGRHVQLPEYLQATEAWRTMAGYSKLLYIELKRRFNGSNNGRIVLSHREAAYYLNIHRNSVGKCYKELEERGFIKMIVPPHLGPEGVGQAAWWALQELPTVDGKAATKGFMSWREK